MKIKGVEIKILRGEKFSARGILDQAVLPEADLYANEKRLRRAAAQALKQCSRAQTKVLRFSVSKASDIFSPVAIAKIIAVWILGAASGFLPMASAAFDPIQPIAIAGAIVPMPIVAAVLIRRIVLISIIKKIKRPFNVLLRGLRLPYR